MAEDQLEGMDEELALGDYYESALQRLQSLGFPPGAVVTALRTAHNDPALAQRILETGLEQRTSEAEEEGEEVQAEGNPLAFLLADEAFLAAREQLREAPERIEEFLDRLKDENPGLLALIAELPSEFQQLLSDDAAAGLRVTEQIVGTRLGDLELTENPAGDPSGKNAGDHDFKRSAIFKKWEPRFFQLRSSALAYYKHQPANSSEKPRKLWPLGLLAIDYKAETRGNYHVFKVYVRNTRTTYVLGTLSAADTKEWTDAVQSQDVPTAPVLVEKQSDAPRIASDLELEDLPKILQKAIPVFESSHEWKLVGDAHWTCDVWHKAQIAVPFALKEMVEYFTDRRPEWDFALSDYRVLSDCAAFNLVLVEMAQVQTVLMQSAVQISAKRHIVIMESLRHVMYPSDWSLTDYLLIEKNKVAGATLITRFVKTSRKEVVGKLFESFRTFPNFMQLVAVRADVEDYNTSLNDFKRAESQADVSICRKTVSFDEGFVYGRGTPFVRDDVGGGLIFLDKVLIGKQKRVLGHMLRSMVANLAKGQSIINVSLPVNIFEPRSILERMLGSFGYAPVFLEQASAAVGVQRLKLVLAWALTILHCSADQGKPFNPILGETFQGVLGSAVCHAEQTSHHPPISNFQVIDTGYCIYGFHEWIVSTGTNSVKGRSKGRTIIKFADSTVEVSLPWVLISGTLMGKRVFNWTGVLSAVDPSSCLYGELVFNPNIKGAAAQPSDYFKGQIAELPQDHAVLAPGGFERVWSSGKKALLDSTVESLCSIEGYWPLYMDADSERVWSFEAFRPFLLVKGGEILPSDSRLREDIVELAKGDEEAAQVQKDRLENIQRHDKQLREHWRKTQRLSKR